MMAELFDLSRLTSLMQARLAVLQSPATNENDYLATRRHLSRSFIMLCLDTSARHIEERTRVYEHAATVAQENIATFNRLTQALKTATAELAIEKSDAARAFEDVANQQLVQTARLAATVGQAREQMMTLFSASHDLQMAKHYAALAEMMELEDPERTERIATAIGRTVAIQGTSIAIGALILGPAGIVTGSLFGLLMDAPALREAFRTQPALAGLNDAALQALDDFEVSAANWCVATELAIRKLRQIREQDATPVDVDEARASVMKRLSEIFVA